MSCPGANLFQEVPIGMDNFLEFLKAVLQGVVQGITEWLPISSTGHLLLIDELVHMTVSSDPVRNEAFFNLFKVLIQFGSILAVIVLYFHKLNPLSPKKSVSQKRDTWRLWGKVLVASIPAGVVGILFDDIIDGALSQWFVIAAALAVYGVLFIVVENRNRTPRINDFEQMDYRTVLLIGVFQMLALIPGTSRSGATIVGAVMLGCSRYVAAEFSFFMAIPAMLGGSAIKLLKFILEQESGFGFTGLEWTVLLTGMIVAFVVSLLVIKFLMNYIKKHDFKVFGYYRIILAVVVVAYFLTTRYILA